MQAENEQKTFRDDPYVHGVACGLREKFDISDDVYSFLVYGLEVPVTADGEKASDMDEAVAIMAIMPPMMPGGVPYPMVTPVLGDTEEAFQITDDAEDLNEMDIVAFYDDEREKTRTGAVVSTDAEKQEVKVMVRDGEQGDDAMEVATVETGGTERDTAINGEPIDFEEISMANDDDEHEKDWWRIEEIEAEMEDA